MSTIARLTGFSPILLRAWERRYELLLPKRGPGGHRLYSEEDLNVLRRVRQLLGTGRSIGEIAGMSREALLYQRQSPSAADSALLDGHGDIESPPAATSTVFADWKKKVIQAALAMDDYTLGRVLDESFASIAAETVLDRLIVPCAREIGELWLAGRCSVASEHLATAAFVLRARKLIESAGGASTNESRVVVSACFPEENHELGLLIVSYHLVRRGVPATFLGSALPFEDLERACRIMRPRVVLLSVTRPALYQAQKPALLDFVEQRKAESLVCVGGVGVPEDDEEVQETGTRLYPPSIRLKEAVNQLSDAAGSVEKRRGHRRASGRARKP